MLEGKLVHLRAVEPGDTERAHRWINDREVTRFLAARYPISTATEEAWMTEASSKQNSFEELRLAIETRDGEHIGMIGLHRGNPESRNAELGIMIGEKEYWSSGYGTDAILTLLRFAFHEMNMHRVGLAVFEFNERGVACYRRCGFVEEGRFRENYYQDGRYWDTIRMSVLRDEFDALQEAASATTAGDGARP